MLKQNGVSQFGHFAKGGSSAEAAVEATAGTSHRAASHSDPCLPGQSKRHQPCSKNHLPKSLCLQFPFCRSTWLLRRTGTPCHWITNRFSIDESHCEQLFSIRGGERWSVLLSLFVRLLLVNPFAFCLFFYSIVYNPSYVFLPPPCTIWTYILILSAWI